jgi:glycosyltransferase involved in cell wall biosynthesis
MLIKDVGQIPLHLKKDHGIDASLVGYKLNIEYPHLNGAASGLPLSFISPGLQTKYFDFGILTFLLKEATSIDVFNLYHYEPHTFFYGIIYKFLNPKGFLYVKLDNDLRSLEQGKGLYLYGKELVKKLFSSIERIFRRKVDLFTIETTKGYSLIIKNYPDIATKLAFLPNGVDTEVTKLDYDFTAVTPSQKENIIITVARLGTKQKNTAGFLETLSKMNLASWKVYFVGPIETEFEPTINEFYLQYPHLKDNVIFTGNITDRKELYELYAKSKIFCLPSLWESFAIVVLEALLFGCHIVCTNFVSAPDLLSKNVSHTIVPIGDTDALALALTDAMNHEIKVSDISNAQQHVISQYDWKQITSQLASKISGQDHG